MMMKFEPAGPHHSEFHTKATIQFRYDLKIDGRGNKESIAVGQPHEATVRFIKFDLDPKSSLYFGSASMDCTPESVAEDAAKLDLPLTLGSPMIEIFRYGIVVRFGTGDRWRAKIMSMARGGGESLKYDFMCVDTRPLS